MPKIKSKKEFNKAYKNWIYSLCSKIAKGDNVAEQKLEEQMAKNTTAVWAVKHWMKRRSQNGDELVSSSKIKTKRSIIYGNAFKPYQGGSPGLGKNS